MLWFKREITKEVYDRAQDNRGYITEADKQELFSDEELFGYGVYRARVSEIDGKYYMSYMLGGSCD